MDKYLNCTVRDIFSNRNGIIIEVTKNDEYEFETKFKVWFLDFSTEIWSLNLVNKCIDRRILYLKEKILKLNIDEQKLIFSKYFVSSEIYIDCITSNDDENTQINNLWNIFNNKYSSKLKIVKKLHDAYVDFKEMKKRDEIKLTEKDEDLAKSLHSNLNSPTKRNSKRLIWNADKDTSKYESGKYLSPKKARKQADDALFY